MGMINLKDWGERDVPIDRTMQQLDSLSRNLRDAQINYFLPPTVSGFGNSSGFQVKVLDQTGTGDLQKLSSVSNEFVKGLLKSPEIDFAMTEIEANYPQYMVHVDQDLAAQKGVSIKKAMSTLQVLMGGMFISDFVRFENLYDVMIQAAPQYRARPEDVLNVQVKNQIGEMVPISSFINMERIYGPEQLEKHNMYNSAKIKGNPAPGYSSGDAIAAIERVAAETLPQGFGYDWYGMSRQEVGSGSQAIYIFMVCIIFVYLLLAAQYESFLLPLPVLLFLPAGIFGSFLALYLLGLENNVYAQVALIMLIGLLGKNAILIIEFAIIRRKEGYSVVRAAIEGSVSRLRPILMTSFAFTAGLIPLCMATGAGAIGNRSIGTAAAGGMITGTIFGLIIIPGLYVLFSKKKAKKQEVSYTESPVPEKIIEIN
jgi:multidrug efflux pump subunit AcrB